MELPPLPKSPGISIVWPAVSPAASHEPSPALAAAIAQSTQPATGGKAKFKFQIRPRPGTGKVQLRAKRQLHPDPVQAAKGVRIRPRKATPTERAAAKAELLAATAAQAKDIADAHANRRTFRAFFQTLSAQEQAFASAHGIDRYYSDWTPPPRPADDGEDERQHEPIAEEQLRGTRNGDPLIAFEHPQDQLEPVDLSVDIANLSPSAVRAASDDFGDALQWAFAPAASRDHQLVELGRRGVVLIALMATDLAAGLPVTPQLAHDFLAYFGPTRYSETLERLRAAGAVYRRVLEWLGRCSTLSEIGERLQLVAYQIRPDLIDAATMQEIGDPKNKSRQAINKLAQCLRDTLDGLRAFIQRPDITRLRCQAAQLAGA